jgi:hypothetical protein
MVQSRLPSISAQMSVPGHWSSEVHGTRGGVRGFAGSAVVPFRQTFSPVIENSFASQYIPGGQAPHCREQ